MSSIFNILQELDNEISEYNKALVALEEKYNIKNGEIEEKLLEDFTQQQQEEKEKFEVQALATENKLDEACRQIRKRQPLLTSLMVDDANLENVLPDEIVLGKYNVSFGSGRKTFIY